MMVNPVIISRIDKFMAIVLNLFFFYRAMEAKPGKKVHIIAIAAFIAVKMAYFISGLGFQDCFSLIMCIAFTRAAFQGNIYSHACWSVSAVAIDGIMDAVILSANLFSNGVALEGAGAYSTSRILITLTAKMLLVAVYWLITANINKEGIGSWQDGLFLIAIPAGCWSMLEAIFKFVFEHHPEHASQLLAVSSVTLLLVIYSSITLYNRVTANSKELAQAKLEGRAQQMARDHISQMNDLYDRLSAVQHDLKNHFFAISGYLKIGDYRAAEEYADSVSSLDIFLPQAMYSTHPILNALIGARRAAADEGDIEFIIDIEMPGELPISDVELCILFGNLIDNAFEANESAFEPRYISISAKTVGGYWAVACRNGTREKAKICSTGSLKSTKKEQGPHGIGTKQIHKIADATGGYVAYNQENYEFTALVMLKLSEEEEDSFEKKDA